MWLDGGQNGGANILVEEIFVCVHVVSEQRIASRTDEDVAFRCVRVQRTATEGSCLLADVQEDQLTRCIRHTPRACLHALVCVVHENLHTCDDTRTIKDANAYT